MTCQLNLRKNKTYPLLVLILLFTFQSTFAEHPLNPDQISALEEMAKLKPARPIPHNPEQPALFKHSADIQQKTTRLFHVKKKAQVYDLKNKQTFLLPEEKFLHLIEEPHQHYFAINKNGEKLFRFYAQDLTRVDQVLNFDHQPLFYQSYSPDPVNTVDEKIKLFLNGSFSYLFFDHQELSKAMGHKFSSQESFRYQMEILVQKNIPLHFGLVTSFQTSGLNPGNGDSYSWNSFSGGPLFRYLVGEWLGVNWATQLNGQYAFYSQLNRPSGKNSDVQHHFIELGFNLSRKWGIFNMMTGASYSRHWTKVNERGDKPFAPDSNHLSALAITIGLEVQN